MSLSGNILVLYVISRLGMGNSRSVSWITAVLAIYISQLSFGIINSVEAMLFPRFAGSPLLYLLLFVALVIFFTFCVCCYIAVEKLLYLAKDNSTPYMGLLLLSILFFFAAELYILHTSYSFSTSALLEKVEKHGALLFLQIPYCVLCTPTIAYVRVFMRKVSYKSVVQAVRAEKVYIAEAKMRYEQAKAFRHDVKNHLVVLDTLLGSGKLNESRAYLEKIETVSESLSFPYQTGNPVVVILLGEKLNLANGVDVKVSLVLPKSCGIDNVDLCVIFLTRRIMQSKPVNPLMEKSLFALPENSKEVSIC